MGWTGRILTVVVLAASTVAISGDPANAGPWCDPKLESVPLGDTVVAPEDSSVELKLRSALCAIARESDQPLVVRFSEDKSSVIVWSRSLIQYSVAERVLAPFPEDVVRSALSDGDPVVEDRSTFIFDPPEFSLEYKPNPVARDVSFAPTPPVSRDLGRAYLIGVALVLAAVAGALYWRPRIGLRAYGGILAVAVGAGVLLFSVIGDSLGATNEGFGRMQTAGLIGGLLIIDAGVIALRGQSGRFRAGQWRSAGSLELADRDLEQLL